MSKKSNYCLQKIRGIVRVAKLQKNYHEKSKDVSRFKVVR